MGVRVRGKATARPEKVGDPTLDFQACGTAKQAGASFTMAQGMHAACQSPRGVFHEFLSFSPKTRRLILRSAPHFAALRYHSTADRFSLASRSRPP